MIESFFESPTHIRRKRRGPIGPYMDRFAADLQHRGYSRNTGRSIIITVSRFSIFAALSGIRDVRQVDHKLMQRFLTDDLGDEGYYNNARNNLRHLECFLQDIGVLIFKAPRVATDPKDVLLSRYDAHLRDVRGLTQSTRNANRRYARQLLTWYRFRYPRRSLRYLSHADVLGFVTSALAEMSKTKTRRRQGLCSCTRSFLRYLRWEEIVKEDLSPSVPSIPCPRLATVPRHLPWSEVQKVLNSVDLSESEGSRDRAILLLIAVLGLRNIEVRELKPEDIDWRAGRLIIRRTKSRKERTAPLTKEVGEALAEYLVHGRPAVRSPYVFVRHRAPYGSFISSASIGSIVKKSLRRAKIEAPSWGSHLLRHSLATRLVNEGVPIKQIADLLGHASIDTTAIYTKVDVRSLSMVALPFPGGDA